jgi:hypothetical protein
MLKILFACVLAIAAGEAFAANPVACKLVKPPIESGENATHGTVFKVFPRAAQIFPGYNGCQSMWMQTTTGWSLTSRLRFRNGQVNEQWSPEFTCQYRDGHLASGPRQSCETEAPKPMQSMPPGCLALTDSSLSPACKVSAIELEPAVRSASLRLLPHQDRVG